MNKFTSPAFTISMAALCITVYCLKDVSFKGNFSLGKFSWTLDFNGNLKRTIITHVNPPKPKIKTDNLGLGSTYHEVLAKMGKPIEVTTAGHEEHVVLIYRNNMFYLDSSTGNIKDINSLSVSGIYPNN